MKELLAIIFLISAGILFGIHLLTTRNDSLSDEVKRHERERA